MTMRTGGGEMLCQRNKASWNPDVSLEEIKYSGEAQN